MFVVKLSRSNNPNHPTNSYSLKVHWARRVNPIVRSSTVFPFSAYFISVFLAVSDPSLSVVLLWFSQVGRSSISNDSCPFHGNALAIRWFQRKDRFPFHTYHTSNHGWALMSATRFCRRTSHGEESWDDSETSLCESKDVRTVSTRLYWEHEHELPIALFSLIFAWKRPGKPSSPGSQWRFQYCTVDIARLYPPLSQWCYNNNKQYQQQDSFEGRKAHKRGWI